MPVVIILYSLQVICEALENWIRALPDDSTLNQYSSEITGLFQLITYAVIPAVLQYHENKHSNHDPKVLRHLVQLRLTLPHSLSDEVAKSLAERLDTVIDKLKQAEALHTKLQPFQHPALYLLPALFVTAAYLLPIFASKVSAFKREEIEANYYYNSAFTVLFLIIGSYHCFNHSVNHRRAQSQQTGTLFLKEMNETLVDPLKDHLLTRLMKQCRQTPINYGELNSILVAIQDYLSNKRKEIINKYSADIQELKKTVNDFSDLLAELKIQNPLRQIEMGLGMPVASLPEQKLLLDFKNSLEKSFSEINSAISSNDDDELQNLNIEAIHEYQDNLQRSISNILSLSIKLDELNRTAQQTTPINDYNNVPNQHLCKTLITLSGFFKPAANAINTPATKKTPATNLSNNYDDDDNDFSSTDQFEPQSQYSHA